MPAVTRELLVFVASPGDCEDERGVVRSTAESVNQAIGGQLGIRLRVEGWEIIPPDLGRPQDHINPLVDNCDVFVGILGYKWGSPSGSHTSGFLEEFERAVQRRTSGGGPHVAVYFRNPTPEMLADPGPELQKVLDFRRRMETEHVLLYRSFEDNGVLERQLWPLFSRLLTETAAPEQLSVAEGSSAGAADGRAGMAEEFEGGELDEARRQIAETTYVVTQMALGGSNGALDSDRFLLIALGLNDDAGSIPTHVVNRLYLRRHDIVLSVMEHETWLRSLLADVGRTTNLNTRVVPGWEKLRSGESQLLELLEDQDDSVVNGVFRTVARLGWRPAMLWGDGKSDVAVCAQRWHLVLQRLGTSRVAETYLANQVSEQDMPLLDQLAAISQSQNVEQLRAALAGDEAALTRAVASRSFEPDWKAAVLTARLPSTEAENVLVLAIGKSTPDGLRRLAAHEIHARGLVTDNALRSLMSFPALVEDVFGWVEDDASPVTAERVRQAVTELDQDAAGRLEVERRAEAASRSVDELIARLDAGNDPIGAWEALGWKGDPRVIERAREMFDTDGEHLVSRLRHHLELPEGNDLIEFIRASARKAALRILMSQDPLPSADRGRLWNEVERGSLYTKQQCLLWLAAIATAEDVEGLLANLSDAYTETAALVVRAILRVGNRDHARQLLEEGNDAHAALAVQALAEDPATTVSELRDSLYSPNAAARMAALGQIIGRSTEAELRTLLEEYPRERTYYYYNVVCELDWRLFAFSGPHEQEYEG